jgi:hypothetical protein
MLRHFQRVSLFVRHQRPLYSWRWDANLLNLHHPFDFAQELQQYMSTKELSLQSRALLQKLVYSASNKNEYQKQNNNVLESRARWVRRADSLTAICKPIVYTMCCPWHLTVCYGDSFTLFYTSVI